MSDATFARSLIWNPSGRFRNEDRHDESTRPETNPDSQQNTPFLTETDTLWGPVNVLLRQAVSVAEAEGV